MPAPVPKSLIPPQATNAMPSTKKHQMQQLQQHQYYQPAAVAATQLRTALAPIVRPSTNNPNQYTQQHQPLSFVGAPSGGDQAQSAAAVSAADYYYHRRSSTNGNSGRSAANANAVVDDENSPYNHYYGGVNNSNSYAPAHGHGLGGQMKNNSLPASSAFGTQRVSDALESAAIPTAAPTSAYPSSHPYRRADREARRSIVTSSWPPSPDGLPPTPSARFEYDLHYDVDDDVDYYRRRRSSTGSSAVMVDHPTLTPVEDDDEDLSSVNVRLSPLSSHDEEENMEEMDVGVVGTAGAEFSSPIENEENAIPADAATMIKQLVPSPSELLKIANEQARANAATFLSDWISEAVWEISVPLMGGHESSTGRGHSRRVSGSGNVKLFAPPPFKRFAQQTIYQVSASAGSLFLALWYIEHLPVRAARMMGEMTEMDVAFREDLMAIPSEIPWRLLVLGLTLSNKWLEDNTFTTKTWHEVTGLSVSSMKSIETKAIAIFDWILSPQLDEWHEFLQQLRRRETMAQLSAIGSERQEARYGGGGHGGHQSISMTSPSVGGSGASQKRPIQVIDELIADLVLTMSSPEPVFPGDALAVTGGVDSPVIERSPVSPATSLAESFTSHGSSQNAHTHTRSHVHQASMRGVVEELYPSLSRPMSWSISDFSNSGLERDSAVGADRSNNMRPTVSIHEEIFRRPEHQQHQSTQSTSSYRAHQYHPYSQYHYQAAAPTPRRIKTPAVWDPSTSARLLDSPVVTQPMSRSSSGNRGGAHPANVHVYPMSDARPRPVYEAIQRPLSLHAGPVPVAPAPRMDEYSRMRGAEVMEVPRAAYGVNVGTGLMNEYAERDNVAASMTTKYVAAPITAASTSSYESANMNAHEGSSRSWYESIPKSIISPHAEMNMSAVGFGRGPRGNNGHAHAGSWAASFSNMIGSF